MRKPERELSVGWIWFGLLLLGFVGVGVSIVAAGGGHGTYLPVALFFPFTMLLAAAAGGIGLVGGTLALLQFPIYATLLTYASKRGALQSLFKRLVVVHAVVAILALGSSFLASGFPLLL